MGALEKLNYLSPVAFIIYTKRCARYFGANLVFYLSLSYFSLKGFSRRLIQLSELPYYELSGQDSEAYQLNRTISNLPWSIKGLMGVVSDVFPLFGYYKTSYLYLTSILGMIASITICLLPYEAMDILPEMPALVFFFIQFQIAAHDLLNEGKYVSIMNIYPETRADIVTYIFLWQTIGYIIPSLSVGIVADNFDLRYLFISMVPLCGHPIVTMMFGCFPEEKVSSDKINTLDREKIKAQWKSMLMALAIAILALISIVVGIFGNNLVKFIYTICAAVFLGSLGFLMLPSMVAKANLYLFLIDTLYTDLEGPLDYFYIADPECVPNGPGFSYMYYRTFTALVGILAQVIGLFIFQTLFTNLKLRYIFWSTTAIRVLASMFDFIMVQRWNINIGIPDNIMYLFGNAIVYNAVYIMDYIPMNTLMSKLCNKGVETTMFAILAGFANFGLSLAGYIGLYAAEIFNVKLGDNIECTYENLPWLILLCHCALPLLNIPLTFILIPDGYISDDLVKKFNEQEEAKRIIKQRTTISA